MTLGRIIVDLLARTGSFDTDLNRSAKLADKRAREIDAAFKRAGKAIGASLGLSIAGTITTIGVALKKSIDRMDEMRDASIRLGIGVKTLSAFAYAAEQTGTDIESLGNGFKILAKNMADALNPKSAKSQIFEALGISVTDATGKLKEFEQIVPEIADRFKQLEDGTTKAALAQELFGKNGLALTEFLNQGGEGIKELTERARELGLVIDQDAADKADKFNDTLADLKGAAMGLATQVADDLLPDLIKLTEWAVGFVQDGKDAGGAAHEIADAIRDIADAMSAIGSAFGFLDDLKGKLSEIQNVLIEIAPLTHLRRGLQETFGFNDDWSRGPKPESRNGEPIPATPVDSMFSLDTGNQGFSAAPFSAVDRNKGGVNRGALNRALSGDKPDKGSTKKAGKSDAEKEAERLAAAYKNLEDSLKEQIALHGQTTEVAKVRYDLENGELAKLGQAQKDNLLGLAAQRDAQIADQEMTEKGKQLIESLITPTEELNQKRKEAADLLAAGKISQDAYNKAIEAYKDPGQQMLEDLQFELELRKMNNAEMATAIQLRGMDAEQVRKYGAEIAEANRKIEEAMKQTEFVDGFRSGMVDLFSDIATGAKSAKDAFRDFFDNMAEMITRMIAERWVEQMFGSFGTTGQGTAGGDWLGTIFGALFGGARANGGPVMDGGSYLVGERGPELFVPRTAGTIVPAAQTARMADGGGMNQVNNIYVQERTNRRTQEQIERAAGRGARRAMARTGG